MHDAVAADFDRFAQLARAEEEDDLYHPFLLDQLPALIDRALDVGCGTGGFTRDLAARATRVTAIDFSAESLRVAKQRSARFGNIDWVHADAEMFAYEPSTYDVIVSLKTLHHLRGEEVVPRLAAALRPGGVLLIHDVLESERGILGIIKNATRMPARIAHRFMRTRRLFERRELREFWSSHARHDQHPRIGEVREFADRLLPGSVVHKHWLWRYTIAWTTPAHSNRSS